jgi:hypothetical protein
MVTVGNKDKTGISTENALNCLSLFLEIFAGIRHMNALTGVQSTDVKIMRMNEYECHHHRQSILPVLFESLNCTPSL